MLTELVLTHPCGQTIYWSAGGYFDGQGQALTPCDATLSVLNPTSRPLDRPLCGAHMPLM